MGPSPRGGVMAYGVGVVIFGLHTALCGQDANWDLQNYHIYAAYALLHWRYPLDVAPGGFQGYLNPLPYLPPYLLCAVLPPLLASLALAMLQAIVVPITWFLAGVLLPIPNASNVTRVFATIAGCTSATVLSEIGTSFADLLLAAFVLTGLAALLKADEGPARQSVQWLVVAGLAVGTASGMKLTNGLYVAGLGAASFVPWRSRRALIRAGLSLGAGFLLGFLVTDGLWSFYLWRNLGNPIFPAMNSVFRSSSAVLSDYTELRFLPKGWIDGLAYPLRIAQGEHPTAEVAFSDPRFLLALPMAVVAIALQATNRVDILCGRALARRRMLTGTAFLIVSFVTWLHFFAIQRYAVALEILAGVMVVAYPARLLRGSHQSVVSALLACAILLLTRPADWWHRPWSQPFKPNIPDALLKPAAFLIVSAPNGYWASILPEQSRFYNVVPMGLAGAGVLHGRLVSGLENPPSQTIWTVAADVPMTDSVRQSLADLGYVASSPCLRVQSLWWVDTVFCKALHAGRRHLAAADLKRGVSVAFNRQGAGWIYERSGWRNSGDEGVGATTSKAGLVFRPADTSGPVMLEASIGRPLATGDIELIINGRPSRDWTIIDTGAIRNIVVCMPPKSGEHTQVELDFENRSGANLNIILHTIRLLDAPEGRCPFK